MAITKTWEVNTCNRDVADGFIKEIIYRIKTQEDGVEIDGTRHTGSVTFTKPESLPSDFIAYVQEEVDNDGNVTKVGTPDQATVLGWIKAALGTDEVTRIEAGIDAKVAVIKTPVEAKGTPWS